MKNFNLIDLFVHAKLEGAFMPSSQPSWSDVNGKVSVSFTGQLSHTGVLKSSQRFFGGSSRMHEDVLRAVVKGVTFTVVKPKGVMRIRRTKGRDLTSSELEAAKQYTAALLVDINALCDRIANEIGQIREAGIKVAISAANVDEAHAKVDKIIRAFAEQAA